MKRIEHQHTSSKVRKLFVLLGGCKLSDRLDTLSNVTINLSSRSFGSSRLFNILSFGAHPLLHVHYPHAPPSCSVCAHGSVAARHEQACNPHCMYSYRMCASLAWLFQCSCTCRHAKSHQSFKHAVTAKRTESWRFQVAAQSKLWKCSTQTHDRILLHMWSSCA